MACRGAVWGSAKAGECIRMTNGRPAPKVSPRITSDDIQNQIEEFKRTGGKIEKVAQGVSGEKDWKAIDHAKRQRDRKAGKRSGLKAGQQVNRRFP